MDISFFWEFLVLAESLNYSEAAYQLSLSESSLSRHIKAFEQELGVTLLNRNSRAVTLTQYGEVMVKYSHQIMNLKAQYVTELKQLKGTAQKTIRICSAYNITSLITAFNIRYPDVKVTLVDDTKDPDVIKSALAENRYDLAFIIYLPKDTSGIEYETFETDHFCAVLPANHPLASRKTIQLSELADENFITFPSEDIKTQKLIENCKNAGFFPKFRTPTKSLNSITSLIKYDGVTLLLRKVAEKEELSGISLVDITPEIPINVYLCTSSVSALSPDAAQFIDFALCDWPKLHGPGSESNFA